MSAAPVARVVLTAVATGALLLAGCGGDPAEPGPGPAAPPSGTPTAALPDLDLPEGSSGSLVAAVDGEMMLCGGWGEADREAGTPAGCDTVHDVMSMTKQFTAAAVVALAQDGLLDLDDPVGEHLGPVPPDKRRITVAHLLTHTSGAVARGEDPDGDPVVSPPDTTTTVTTRPAPALTIEKTAATDDVNDSGITDAGDTISYAFHVVNTGNVTLHDVAVSDELLDGLGIAVACDEPSLVPGGSTDCRALDDYVVTEADEARGEVVNVARAVATPSNDPGASTRSPEDGTTTPVTRPAPALTVEKQAGDPVDGNRNGITDRGDTIGFTFTVTNTGNVPVEDVAIDDPMLDGIPIDCAADRLEPGDSTTCAARAPYVVTAGDVVAGAVANTATAVGTDPDGDPVRSPEDRTSTPTTQPRPALDLEKTAAARSTSTGTARSTRTTPSGTRSW